MKTIQVLKAILTGAIAGAAIFFIPFPFRFFFYFLSLSFLHFAFLPGAGGKEVMEAGIYYAHHGSGTHHIHNGGKA